MEQIQHCYSAVLLAGAVAAFAPAAAVGQAASVTLEATVVDASTGKEIPTVVIRNPARGTGTASDAAGAFALPSNLPGDTLVLSHPGYHTERVPLLAEPAPYIGMTPHASELGDVVVLTDGDTEDYLFDLIHDVRRRHTTGKRVAKTYSFFEGKVGGILSELAEGYFNGTYADGAPVALAHKKSRLGLRPIGAHLISTAPVAERLRMFDLYEPAPDFPENPLCVSRARAKKEFALSLADRYHEGGTDVFVVDFAPASDTAGHFAGRMWLDRGGARLLRATLAVEDARRHPIVNGGPGPGGGLRIDRSFVILDGEAMPATTRLECSGVAAAGGEQVAIELSALTVAYDYVDRFALPSVHDAAAQPQSYRDASAAPYDSAFWARTNEFRLYDRSGAVEKFVKRRRLRADRVLEFRSPENAAEASLETPFLVWSFERVDFRSGEAQDMHYLREAGRASGTWVESGARLYLDVSELPGGEVAYQTAAAIDPLAASFPSHIDPESQAFLNMQFDLLEIQRRWLVEEIESQPTLTRDVIELLHGKHERAYEKRRDQFERETRRGRKTLAMEMWSQHIYEQLGVDNFRRYGLGRS